MRRADPPSVVSDSEGSPLPAYADSDVGSSPRSAAGGIGGRAGSLTEEPAPAVKWDDAAFARVKLMCSYGGRILPRPHDNQLRYVGGESRIAVVSRGITFSELTAKLSRMFGSSVAIKYQLPYEDLDALITVTADEDLENMMEEYDRLQSVGNPNFGNRASASARLRLFLFPLKLERSQTVSLSEMMENDHSRERCFVDILNGSPLPSHVRSESSSIVSETPDYAFQGNIDALEVWAAAASYGNSLAPPTDQFIENQQGNPVPPASLLGSLLHQAGSNEVASAPGSPSPLKPKSNMMGSSSSAPPAVISFLSTLADAASKGLPTPTTEVEGSMGSLTNKTCLGSSDSSGSIPEQRKHVDSEILLTSDKSILSSSLGGAEQLLPAGLMDDDDSSRKHLSKGSFDEVSDSSETATLDAGVHHVMSEPSRAFKGDLVSESSGLKGQPIFDDELLPTHMLAQNLNGLQLDERVPSPSILSPSSTSPASAPLLPPVLAPQQPISAAMMPKFGAESKQYAFPVSPRAGAHLGGEDKAMQPFNVILGLKGDIDDGSSRQVSPSLAHFLPSLIVPQQPSNTAGEESMLQILGANAAKDFETTRKIQASTSGSAAATSPSLVTPTVQQQKVPVVPVPSYFYQQSPAHGLEVPMSATTYATQAPGIQFPLAPHIPAVVAGAVTNSLPPIAVPPRPANVAVASRPAAGSSHPQSPPVSVSQHTSPLLPQVAMASPAPLVPSIAVSNVSQSEALKGHTPIVGALTIIPAMGEGVRSIPYQQSEVVNLPRQVSDPGHNQRLTATSPQLGNHFNAPNLSVTPAPGMPTRFRAMGHPIQQVAEGIPLQQAPLVSVISDKKAPAPMPRAGTSPSSRQTPAHGGQFSYFMVDQPNAIAQSAALGGGPRYNAPSNDTPLFAGANPFVDSYQAVSAYQDGLEAPPADQQQRRPMR